MLIEIFNNPYNLFQLIDGTEIITIIFQELCPQICKPNLILN